MNALVDADLTLKLDARWRRNVQREMSLFVLLARKHWSDYVKYKRTHQRMSEGDAAICAYMRGNARGLVGAARQLKGLL